MLGTVYPVEFYNDIKDNRIRDPLCRITEESQEDLENFEYILKQFHCEVIRCDSEIEKDISDWVGQSIPIPRNALNPRDGQLVAGNSLVHTSTDNKGIAKSLLSLKPDSYIIHPKLLQGYKSVCDAPAMTIVGKDLYFDTLETHYGLNLEKDILNWFKQKLPDFRINTVESNDIFINFVESWLGEWVGYCEETVFDVNVLVLDEHHVCITDHKQKNKPLEEFLKKHRMEPVYVPWRHRYFWDGSLHCITLDLVREGIQQDYFPERGQLGISAKTAVDSDIIRKDMFLDR
jgi:hypothetical protein